MSSIILKNFKYFLRRFYSSSAGGGEAGDDCGREHSQECNGGKPVGPGRGWGMGGFEKDDSGG